MTRGEIMKAVADRYEVSVKDMAAAKQSRGILGIARQAAMYEMRAAGRWSAAQIAAMLNVERSVVIHGADQHAARNGIEPPPKRPAPQTQKRCVDFTARIVKHEGQVDGLRFGRIWIGPSQLAFRFDRLTGKVRLFKNDTTGATPMTEIFSAGRLEAARLACVEKFGVIEP